MKTRLPALLGLITCLLALQCGLYTFSGSSLPAHIKTVSIPLFNNRTMEPGIAEELTRMVSRAYITNNALRVTEKDAHAVLLVSISAYNHEPHTYDAQGNVREYIVRIQASAIFRDEKRGKDLWKEENISCQGIYSHEAGKSENENTGKRRAMDDLSRILIENTISGW